MTWKQINPGHPHSARSLVRHWEDVTERGEIPARTGQALSTTTKRILNAVAPDWETVDVTALDTAKTMAEYERGIGGEVKDTTRAQYRSNFRRAFERYLAYLAQPDEWRPQVRRPGAAQSRTGTPHPSLAMVEHKFPFRPHTMVRLTLPRDVTTKEMRRLCDWLRTLPIDYVPASRPARDVRALTGSAAESGPCPGSLSRTSHR